MGAALADTDIRRRFDLVGVDPRGVGHSTPQLRCRTDAEFDAYRREPMADYSPAGVAHIEDVYRQFAQDCTERDGQRRSWPTSAPRRRPATWTSCERPWGRTRSTTSGFSYGTEIGAAYAEAYPDRIRAMVLDGAVDPSVDPDR